MLHKNDERTSDNLNQCVLTIHETCCCARWTVTALKSVRFLRLSQDLFPLSGGKLSGARVNLARTINNVVERFMLSARNTGDVWPLGYAELLGFLRRVGSRVKRILFPRHYVIAARVAAGHYIGAVREERELPSSFFLLGEKAFFPALRKEFDRN